MFRIIKENQPLKPRGLNILIFGEAGTGKTSLACTSKNNILFDFEQGASRSDFAKEVGTIDDYSDIAEHRADFIKEIASFDSIIVDTVDALITRMGLYAITKEPKLSLPKYLMQYYGQLKKEYESFSSQIQTLNKNFIQIAHVKEKEEGDVKIKRPNITGSSKDTIIQYADFVGYMFIENNIRKIRFNPTENCIGKDSAKLGTIEIPDFEAEPLFLENLIAKMKEKLNKRGGEQLELLKKIKEIKEKIESLQTLEQVNQCLADVKLMSESEKKKVWSLLKGKAIELNFEFSNDKKIFENPVSSDDNSFHFD